LAKVPVSLQKFKAQERIADFKEAVVAALQLCCPGRQYASTSDPEEATEPSAHYRIDQRGKAQVEVSFKETANDFLVALRKRERSGSFCRCAHRFDHLNIQSVHSP
jgi:hypothetical protein